MKRYYKMKSKKKKRDWFDDHVIVIGENSKKVKEKIKKDFIKEFTDNKEEVINASK